MKWLWSKLKSIPLLGWILAGVAGVLGVLKFSGGNWWERRRAKKAIEAEEKKLDEEKKVEDEKREDRRAAAHDACPFDE